jgi:hypothetical protein
MGPLGGNETRHPAPGYAPRLARRARRFKPKKDGWYEHGQNCAEYPEFHFGNEPPKPKRSDRYASFTPLPTGPAGWMAQ